MALNNKYKVQATVVNIKNFDEASCPTQVLRYHFIFNKQGSSGLIVSDERPA